MAEPWVRGRHADFASDLANSGEAAAIGTAAVFQHLVAEDAFLESVERLLGFGLFGLFGEESEGLFLGGIDTSVAIELAVLFRV